MNKNVIIGIVCGIIGYKVGVWATRHAVEKTLKSDEFKQEVDKWFEKNFPKGNYNKEA